MLRIAGLMVVSATTMTGCRGMNDNAANAMYAVEQRDPAAVQQAVAARRGLEQRDESGSTPLLKALASGQYTIAEILVDGGADIWAVDEFGLTAGHFLSARPLPAGSVEGDAQHRLVTKLRARGFPWPPPAQGEVRAMVGAGQWPPRQVVR